MSTIVPVGRAQVTVPENMFRQVPIISCIYKYRNRRN